MDDEHYGIRRAIGDCLFILALVVLLAGAVALWWEWSHVARMLGF